jgi:2'-5' RNA ligase
MDVAERRSLLRPAPPVNARLFLALWPPPGVRARLAAWRDAWRFAPGAAPTPDDRLHLTLHFIGAVPRARLADVADALDVRATPFALTFGRCEVWPGGIAVLQPDAVPALLCALHADLRARLLGLGLPVEDRPFKAHVTCARRAGGAVPPAPGSGALRWPVHGHALVESRLGQGSGYVVLRRYPATNRGSVAR